MSRKLLFYSLVATLVVLSIAGCAEKNPVKIGKGAKLQAEARAIERTNEQEIIERKNAESEREAQRARTQAVWDSTYAVRVVMTRALLIAMFATASLGIFIAGIGLSRAFAHFAIVRASVLPEGNTGRPALIWREQKFFPNGIRFNRAFQISETKFTLVDTMTGDFHDMDIEQPANDMKLEIYRQALLNWQTVSQQAKTNGENALHIGQSAPQIPAVIDLEAVTEFKKELTG